MEKRNQARPAGPHGPMAAEKAKDFNQSLKKLFKYLKPYHATIVIALVFAMLGAIFSIVSPKIQGEMTNEIQKGISFDVLTQKFNMSIDLAAIGRLAIILLVLYLLSLLFNFIQGFIMSDVAQKITRSYRTQLSQKVNRLPLSYFDSQLHGNMLSIITNDVDLVATSLNQSLPQLMSSITTILGIIIMMFTISWQMTLIALIGIPVSAVLIMLIMGKTQGYFKENQEALGDINGHIEEVFSGHQVIKVNNGHPQLQDKFNGLNNRLGQAIWKSQFFSGLMMPITSLINNLTYVGIAVVGGLLALEDKIMIGGIQSMIQYVRRLQGPMSQIAQSMTSLQSAVAAAERVHLFLEEDEMSVETETIHDLSGIQGNIIFENVSFGYHPDKRIINGFSAAVRAGQKIAIVGPTGAGKTTLVNLLMKFYEIDGGDILFDGISIHDLTRQQIASLFGMVLQDTWLFKGSIFENLRYGNEALTLEEVKAAAEKVNVAHFIESLPHSYDMILDEESNISAGQKQLLTITRAILENAPMIILDEATSWVDTRSEVLIQKAMDTLMEGRTTFVIAHRLSTIKNSDLIIVMDQGDIVEVGNHEQLMKQAGFYYNLYQSQFELV